MLFFFYSQNVPLDSDAAVAVVTLIAEFAGSLSQSTLCVGIVIALCCSVYIDENNIQRGGVFVEALHNLCVRRTFYLEN